MANSLLFSCGKSSPEPDMNISSDGLEGGPTIVSEFTSLDDGLNQVTQINDNVTVQDQGQSVIEDNIQNNSFYFNLSENMMSSLSRGIAFSIDIFDLENTENYINQNDDWVYIALGLDISVSLFDFDTIKNYIQSGQSTDWPQLAKGFVVGLEIFGFDILRDQISVNLEWPMLVRGLSASYEIFGLESTKDYITTQNDPNLEKLLKGLDVLVQIFGVEQMKVYISNDEAWPVLLNGSYAAYLNFQSNINLLKEYTELNPLSWQAYFKTLAN